MSLNENISLNHYAMNIISSIFDDPPQATVGSSLVGSEYNLYALNIINCLKHTKVSVSCSIYG